MSRAFRNALVGLTETKAFVSPVPMAAALRVGSGERRASSTKKPRKKKPPLAVPGSVFDVRMPRKKKPPLAVPGSVFDVRMPKASRSRRGR